MKPFSLLYFLLFSGLLFVPTIYAAPTHLARKLAYGLAFLCVNLGALDILWLVYRWNAGIQTAGLSLTGPVDILRQIWLPVLIILILNLLIVNMNNFVRKRIDRSGGG